jgi:transposase InsO family protein
MHLASDYGVNMNSKKIQRIMKKYGLVTKVRKRNPYKDIMKETQEHRTFENILDRNFNQLIPSRVLCTDITYTYYNGRKAYLSVVKDIATHEVVSWELSNNLSMKFVLDTIDNLKNIPGLSNQTIIHSDQGFHYTNPEYIKKVESLNLVQSMSRKGTCIDNSPIESFFGHFKDDVDFKQAKTFLELKTLISNYMTHYNTKRYQWNLQKMTPVSYRDHLLALTM